MSISNSFLWRKQILEDVNLHSTTKLVAMMLHYHMDNNSCECFPSEALIAKEASLTERCVVNHIKKLKDKFYIHIRKEKGGQGWNRNCYQGIIRAEYNSESSQEVSEFQTKGNEYEDKKLVNEVQSNSSYNSSYNSIELDNFFNQFWEMYPEENRYNKTKCHYLWKKNKLYEIGQQIIDGLKSAKSSKQWQEGYIPSAFKFIDDEQWQKVYKPKTPIFRGIVI